MTDQEYDRELADLMSEDAPGKKKSRRKTENSGRHGAESVKS